MKACRRCRQPCNLSEFARCKSAPDGLQDRCKDCNREYRAANRARAADWRARNRDHILAYNRCYEPRMLAALKARHKHIREHTVPFTPGQLRQRLAYFGNRCWICSEAADHLDHVKPIKAGGWHMLGNIRPACSRCNHRKYSLWPITENDLQRIRTP